jgi:hypothetical protein
MGASGVAGVQELQELQEFRSSGVQEFRSAAGNKAAMVLVDLEGL